MWGGGAGAGCGGGVRGCGVEVPVDASDSLQHCDSCPGSLMLIRRSGLEAASAWYHSSHPEGSGNVGRQEKTATCDLEYTLRVVMITMYHAHAR